MAGLGLLPWAGANCCVSWASKLTSFESMAGPVVPATGLAAYAALWLRAAFSLATVFSSRAISTGFSK